MNKENLIQTTKVNIQKIRKNSPSLNEKEIKIALGKVIIELKDAKKYDNNILKTLFTL